jgi:hypothetical protein
MCRFLILDLIMSAREGFIMTRRVFFFLTIFSIAGVMAWSIPQDDNYSRIARLSYLEGQVSVQHATDEDWAAASINFPLQPGDRIYTGANGRAEIEFDDGSVYHLAENTDIELLSLKDDLVQLRIFEGLSTLKVLSSLEFEVDTPAAAFNTLRNGVYRFNVVGNGATDAVVRKGGLEAANNRFSRRLGIGELLHVEPGENGLDSLSRYYSQDRWDDWTDRRAAEVSSYADAKYIPAGVSMGSSELKRYGRWVEVESYGSVWMPLYVDASWSPYSSGRWCYRPLWGWTWVSYEPWGWLPYHYGRWHHSSRVGWCWIPGPAFTFNFWSPGLVAFYQGPGWISWGPLGPGDYYNVDNYYFNRRLYSYELVRLRALHSRRSDDHINRNVRGAFRIVDSDHFRNGVFNERDRNSRWGNVEPWKQGSLVRDRLNLQPTAASYRPNPNRPGIRPVRVNPLPVVARSVPSNTNRNNSRITPILTPGGYSSNRRSSDRSPGGRTENSRPSNQPQANQPRQAEPRDQQSPLRSRPSLPETRPRTDGNSQANPSSGAVSKPSDSRNAPEERQRIMQSPSVPQRPSAIPRGNPVPQAPPRSTDSGTVRRFGTPRPPDPVIKGPESKPQERSSDRVAPDSRKSNEASSQERGNSDSSKSNDRKESKESNQSDQSSRRARPR